MNTRQPLRQNTMKTGTVLSIISIILSTLLAVMMYLQYVEKKKLNERAGLLELEIKKLEADVKELNTTKSFSGK